MSVRINITGEDGNQLVWTVPPVEELAQARKKFNRICLVLCAVVILLTIISFKSKFLIFGPKIIGIICYVFQFLFSISLLTPLLSRLLHIAPSYEPLMLRYAGMIFLVSLVSTACSIFISFQNAVLPNLE